MSWLSTLSGLMGNVGRGAEDLFTLGGTELARKFGGQGAQNVLNPLATGLGSNFTAGAVGGTGMMGAGMGGGAGGMTSYMPTSVPNMGMAGSTLGGGMGSSLNLAPAYGSSMGAAPGMPVAAAGASGSLPQIPGMGRGMNMPQRPNPQQILQQLYQMFPSLRPGAPIGQGMNIGGM